MSGDSLFVARWGDGPDVVFLHGLMASSRYWEPLQALAEGADFKHSALNLRVVDGDHHLALRRPGVVGDALAAALDGTSGT